jgi:hypothetical protein
LHFQDLVPKENAFFYRSLSHLVVQRKSKGVRNVLLDSYDDSLETLIVFTFSEHLESCIFVDNIIWVVENNRLRQESSWIPPGVRDVLLASSDDMQKTGETRTIYSLVGNLIPNLIQPQ